MGGLGGRDLHKKTGGGWVRENSLSGGGLRTKKEEALSQATDSEWEKELLRARLSKNQNRSNWCGRDDSLVSVNHADRWGLLKP